MKKMLLVLGMITCILGLTACGKTEPADQAGKLQVTEEDAIAYADQLIGSINNVVANQMEEQYASEPVISGAFESWKSALEDMGSYQSVEDHKVTIGEDSVVINALVKGTKRDANVEIILDKDLQLSSVSANVKYSMAELMEKAALNTILGMGTVFAVLILISAIISCFVFIPKIQAAFTKKDNTKEMKNEAVDNTIAQIVENEEMSDDLELVAVISAAIAASTGAASTDGFVVRSIKRANTNKWRNA